MEVTFADGWLEEDLSAKPTYTTPVEIPKRGGISEADTKNSSELMHLYKHTAPVWIEAEIGPLRKEVGGNSTSNGKQMEHYSYGTQLPCTSMKTTSEYSTYHFTMPSLSAHIKAQKQYKSKYLIARAESF